MENKDFEKLIKKLKEELERESEESNVTYPDRRNVDLGIALNRIDKFATEFRRKF